MQDIVIIHNNAAFGKWKFMAFKYLFGDIFVY